MEGCRFVQAATKKRCWIIIGAAANPRRFGCNTQDMHTGSSAVFQLLLSLSLKPRN